jgi:protocatechuate 3,4-dioxygenase beta subunit
MKRHTGVRLSRREALGVLGVTGAVLLVGCGEDAAASNTDGGTGGLSTDGGTLSPDGGTVSCVLDPNLTKGPYWIEERLNRSNITSDSNDRASANPRPGLPLTLQFAVYAYDAGTCTPLPGAQVDVWHCDGSGLYSDVSNSGSTNTASQNFLRGYQVTDVNGIATFTTIYPGWYAGRTVHIHVKVRLFDVSSNTTTEATTQIFFDDGISDAVFASNAPYDSRGTRTTRNADDNIYGGQTQLLVALQGGSTSGYSGTVSLGVRVGAVSAG